MQIFVCTEIFPLDKLKSIPLYVSSFLLFDCDFGFEFELDFCLNQHVHFDTICTRFLLKFGILNYLTWILHFS